MAAPQGAIVWDALMQYTARVTTTENNALADVLGYRAMQQFVAVVISMPDDSAIEPILSLQHRGYNVLVVVPDPASFPIDSSVSSQGFTSTLERQGIPTRTIQQGDDWAQVISES